MCLTGWAVSIAACSAGGDPVAKAFARVGGFPDIPLMEDIAFSSAMRRMARPACLAEKVTTSGRRWEKHGVWRTILMMWWLRLRFWFGVSPQTLAREYGYVPRHD